jgi:hypothetical protein
MIDQGNSSPVAVRGLVLASLLLLSLPGKSQIAGLRTAYCGTAADVVLNADSRPGFTLVYVYAPAHYTMGTYLPTGSITAANGMDTTDANYPAWLPPGNPYFGSGGRPYTIRPGVIRTHRPGRFVVNFLAGYDANGDGNVDQVSSQQVAFGDCRLLLAMTLAAINANPAMRRFKHPGDTLTFILATANTGLETLTEVQLALSPASVDPLTDCLWDGAAGTLLVGEQVECIVDVPVSQADVDRGWVEISASATARTSNAVDIDALPVRVTVLGEAVGVFANGFEAR